MKMMIKGLVLFTLVTKKLRLRGTFPHTASRQVKHTLIIPYLHRKSIPNALLFTWELFSP